MKTFVTGGSGFLGRTLIRALIQRGDEVTALARSEAAIKKVTELGAVSYQGDLGDVTNLIAAMSDCSVVFHCAAHAESWGPLEIYEKTNVVGTANVLKAARLASVSRLVHVSTEAIFADGSPLVKIDETRPRPIKTLQRYPETKLKAELLVEQSNCPELSTVIVRPRLIWGDDDTSVLPQIVRAVREGKFAWIGGGRHLTSTCHVRNVVAGMLAAADFGRGGEAYFLTDGEPVEFRAFMTTLIGFQGVEAGSRSLPIWLAILIASAGDFIWDTFKLAGSPPLPRLALRLFGREVTVIDQKARRELHYKNVISLEEGLEALSPSVE